MADASITEETMKRMFACSILSLLCAAALAQKSTFTTLVSFDVTDGSTPSPGALIQATDGNFYGTTESGGVNGSGVVYQMTPASAINIIYNFCSQANCADGGTPLAGVIQATDGNLYGTTTAGGANNCGTVYQLSLAGTLKTLHSFCSEPGNADGYSAEGTLAQFNNDIYGTTAAGGTNSEGTVFSIAPESGKFETRYNFCSEPNCTDGAVPVAGLRREVGLDPGKFYGTTEAGGANNAGTFFSIKYNGGYGKVYDFCSLPNCADGGAPTGNLVKGADNTYYGTTSRYGASQAGTVFSATIFHGCCVQKFYVLHSFCSKLNCADGASPQAGLTWGNNGNLFGETIGGGTGLEGTIFEITTKGLFETLYNFCSLPGCADGGAPSAPLIESSDGNFYGTTSAAGANGFGTIFELELASQ
jgi:uncharacterized repeat protein (TIGR03803 family)